MRSCMRRFARSEAGEIQKMVEEILDNSLNALSGLNQTIDALLGLFQEIEDWVCTLVNGLVRKFLANLENSVQSSGDAQGAEIINDFTVSRLVKKVRFWRGEVHAIVSLPY